MLLSAKLQLQKQLNTHKLYIMFINETSRNWRISNPYSCTKIYISFYPLTCVIEGQTTKSFQPKNLYNYVKVVSLMVVKDEISIKSLFEKFQSIKNKNTRTRKCGFKLFVKIISFLLVKVRNLEVLFGKTFCCYCTASSTIYCLL